MVDKEPEINPAEMGKSPDNPPSLVRQGRFDRERLVKNIITSIIGTTFIVSGIFFYLYAQRGIEESSVLPASLSVASIVFGGGVVVASIVDIALMQKGK